MLHLKILRIKSGKFLIISGTFMLFHITATAGEVWTLESSVQQAIKISPRILAADAEIDARKSALSQAGVWPNPAMGLGVDEKLGIDDGTGGTDFTSVSISQPISIGRLSRQRKQAKAELQTANYERFYQQLLQENAVARYFHKLQLTEAKLNLAEEKLAFANSYRRGKNGRDPLVRYLSKLDRKRLDLIPEITEQEVTTAEGEYNEALSNFRTFLNLSQDGPLRTAPLKIVQLPGELAGLLKVQDESHANIIAAKYKRDASDASVSIARNKRFPDPVLTLYREKDILNGKRQSFNGITINFTVPIWNFNNGSVSRAKANAMKARYELQALKRDLQAELRETHLHLGHLIEQAEHYRTKILGSAKGIFKLTQQSFATGEVKILSLVDANNTYFKARNRYLELLYESWIEAANLRLVAGLSLQTDNIPAINSGEGS